MSKPRVIKFRALYEGVWYYQTLEEMITITLAAFRNGKHKSQFTGLLDEDGKEIYEGDIVETIMGFKHSVEWNDDTCKFQMSNGMDINDGENYAIYKRVVGNIHENPELLK